MAAKSNSPPLRIPRRQDLARFFLRRDLVFRPGTPSDVAGVQKLAFSIYDEFGMTLGRWYEKHPDVFAHEWIGDDPNRRSAYVLVDPTLARKEAIVGSGVLIAKNPRKEPGVGEISKMYLAPELRGKGFGRRMLTELVHDAMDFGYEKLFLTSRTEWQDALRLYAGFGFRQVPNTRYRGIKAVVEMELRLR